MIHDGKGKDFDSNWNDSLVCLDGGSSCLLQPRRQNAADADAPPNPVPRSAKRRAGSMARFSTVEPASAIGRTTSFSGVAFSWASR